MRFSEFLIELRSGRIKNPLLARNIPTIQEELKSFMPADTYPWSTVVACILLNRTTGKMVRRYIYSVLKAYPDPVSMANANKDELAKLITVGGFQNQKASTLISMSQEWRNGVEIQHLPGVGPYALASYRMFVRDEVPEIKPSDQVLSRLWLAYRQHIDNS